MIDPRYSVTVDGEALDDELTHLLTRLEVRESDGEPGVAALRFQLMQVADGSFAPLDLDLFRPSARVRVDVEPPGGRLTTLFHGTVTHLRPHFEAIESNGYLEVLAMDAGALLDLEERAQVYDDLTDDDIVRRVFERYDIAVAADATPRRRDATAQRGTDWALVQRLARLFKRVDELFEVRRLHE